MTRMLEVLERIAVALEALNEGNEHSPEQMEQVVANQTASIDLHRRQVEASELHNRMHLEGTAHPKGRES